MQSSEVCSVVTYGVMGMYIQTPYLLTHHAYVSHLQLVVGGWAWVGEGAGCGEGLGRLGGTVLRHRRSHLYGITMM